MGKRKLVELTLEKKKEVLDHLAKGESCRKLAENYGISKSTVSSINGKRSMIMDLWEQNCNADRKRVRKTANDELNQKVLEFYRNCRAKNIPISGSLLQEKAKEIAIKLEIIDFSASNGWLDRLRKRNNIRFNVLCGESTSANLQAADDWKRKLPSLLVGYAEEDIFIADESGVFYRELPTRSVIEKGETCKGGKRSKERITVLFCCNSKGEKLKPLVIGNATRVFKANNVTLDSLPVTWRFNKKAWMTPQLFSEWLNDVNLKMKRAKRKILLFVDNATSHVNLNLSNIKIRFLPSNVANEVQPLDKGIIQTVKLIYRKQLMRALINAEKCSSIAKFSRAVTVLDAIRWIHGAWSKISQHTIQKCFHQAGFLPYALEDTAESEDDDLLEEINCLPNGYRNQLPDVQALSTFDDILEVHENAGRTMHTEMGYVMSESDVVLCEYSSSNEEEIVLCEDKPTHDRAMQCIQELERYAIYHNQPEIVAILFGLREIVDRAKVKAKRQYPLTDYFSRNTYC